MNPIVKTSRENKLDEMPERELKRMTISILKEIKGIKEENKRLKKSQENREAAKRHKEVGIRDK